MTENNDILKQLADISGKGNVTDEPEKTAVYTRDQSFSQVGKADYAVYPGSAEEVRKIVELAVKKNIPVVPRSSAVSLHGAGIPSEGGIIVDLKNMNRIVEINDRNWYAIIEPGVTFAQLQEELKSHGFRIAGPLPDPPSASVISSYMERNPVITAADFTFGSELIVSYTIVAPGGEIFTVGHPPLDNAPAGAPDGPGLNFYRIFQGAQGTLGIVTQMIIRVLPIPKAQKILFFPCSKIEETIDIIRKIQKKELGLECFALNNFNLAAMLVDETDEQAEPLKNGSYIGLQGAEQWAADQLQQFDDLRKKLPQWTVVLCLSAVGPIPDEKIAYQELDLKDDLADTGVETVTAIDGIPGLGDIFAEEILLPYRMQKRFGYRGSCHQIMLCCAPDRASDINAAANKTAEQCNYPVEDVGIYLLPMERGRAFYCSYDLHCSLSDSKDIESVRTCFDKMGEALFEQGAFYDRPYGKWADLVYQDAGKYTDYLKRIKKELDPNNIMNPGKLCF